MSQFNNNSAPGDLHFLIMPGFHHSVAILPLPLHKFRENSVSAVRIMPSFQHSVAVLPLPLLLHKFRKNFVSAVRITLLVSTIPLRCCRSHLPLCHNCHSVANRIEFYFCRSAVGGQPISVRVHCSNAVNGKTFPAIPFSCAMATAATERKNSNGMVETSH